MGELTAHGVNVNGANWVSHVIRSCVHVDVSVKWDVWIVECGIVSPVVRPGRGPHVHWQGMCYIV